MHVNRTASRHGTFDKAKTLAYKNLILGANPPQERTPRMKPTVVFHIDFDQQHRLLIALTTIRNLFDEAPGRQASIYVVADADSVAMFRKDRGAAYAADVDELNKLGVRFLVCEEAAKRFGLSKEDLLGPCRMVKSGIWELIRLQHEGFAYIKP
jgi:uncharacterized protein